MMLPVSERPQRSHVLQASGPRPETERGNAERREAEGHLDDQDEADDRGQRVEDR